MSSTNIIVLLCLVILAACGDSSSSKDAVDAVRLPLVLVEDVELPGSATRFDYQDVDLTRGHLVVAHMNDSSVLILDLDDGSVLKEIKNIPVARGVVVAEKEGLVFVTSSPSSLVIINSDTMTEDKRVETGSSPDGVGWDPTHKIVGVSDQGDGAISLIPDSGNGTRTQIHLGRETGNVIFDESRGWFWITVVADTPPDQLVAVDPMTVEVKKTIDLPDCSGAHGLLLHPDSKSAYVACESNSVLARVDLAKSTVIETIPTGVVPDVMDLDPDLGWLYVAAELGDLTVVDINKPGLVLVGTDQPGAYAHSIAVDPNTHRVFFPLEAGKKGKPVLRIMKPSGL